MKIVINQILNPKESLTIFTPGNVLTNNNINWQVVTNNIVAVVNKKYAFNTSTDSISVTLPENPNINDRFLFSDLMKTFDLNSLIIKQASSGELIQYKSENYEINEKGLSGEIVFLSHTTGWTIL